MALNSLCLTDNELGHAQHHESSMLIRAVLSSESLREVNMSGNDFGDSGAITLAEMLARNSTLSSLRWDRNGTDQKGLSRLSVAVQKNEHIVDFPFPKVDRDRLLATNPDTKPQLKRWQSVFIDSLQHNQSLQVL